MTDALTRLLASREWLMADGATGTNLFNMGLSSIPTASARSIADRSMPVRTSS